MSHPTSDNAAPVRYFPGPGTGSVELVPDATKFSVVFSTERSPMSPAAKSLLRDRSEPIEQIPHYGVRVYRGPNRDARDASLVALNRERAIDLAAPVMHRHTADGEEVYVTRNVLVQFSPDVERAVIDDLVASLGATIVRSLEYAPNGFQLLAAAASGGLGAIELANALRNSGRTIFAHPDLISRRHRRTTLDTRPTTKAVRVERNGDYVSQQWHLTTARVTDAWSLTRGSSGITVAILDDGVDVSHPELDGRVVAQWDFTAGVGDGTPKTDDDKHGTACAGVAVAHGVRAAGAAPDCSLMAVRFPATLGDSDEADMFRWAADNGADVISCSWGPADGTGQSDPLPGSTQAAIHYCLTNGRGGKGIPICWAAGNGDESADLDGYAANPEVMAIAAVNDRGTRSWYSDHGAAIFVAAPSSGDRDAGERSITTIDRQGSAGYNDGSEGLDADYTNSFGGTSSASPLVAGIVGLILSANPDLTAAEVRTVLQDTARKIGSGYDSQGHSSEFGYGLVDAYEAVRHAQAAAGKVTPAPGQPSIIGPSTIGHTDPAPQFEVDPGGGNSIYYAVEVATSSDLLDGGDHGSDSGFYGSWQDTPFQSSNPYVLPDEVWERMRDADTLYYRAWLSSDPNAWQDVVVTTEDANSAQAPSIAIGDSGFVRSARALTRDAPRARDDLPAMHAGFDRLGYPGDDVMQHLWNNTNLAWTGFYLAPAPSQPNTSWMSKAALLRGMGWGLAPIFVGQQLAGGPGAHNLSAAQGTTDAARAVELANTAAIGDGSVIYLDIEAGGGLPQAYLDYAQAWIDGIRGTGYRPGVYCSYKTTADQIRAANPDVFFWVFNVNKFATSAFQESAGVFRTPQVDQSGCSYAVAWQFIQGANGVTVPHGDGTSGTLGPVDFDSATVLDPSHPEVTADPGPVVPSGPTGTPTISGPASVARSRSAPQFDLTPAEGSAAIYYAVEVATSADLFDDASHTIEDGFYASWNDTTFLSSNPYVLPDAAWQLLGGSASTLYYRAWFSASDTEWIDAVTTTPSVDRASAPSITVTDDGAEDRSVDREVRHPAVSTGLTAVRGGNPPVFSVTLPGATRSWWLELTTDVSTFGLDGAAGRTDENFWQSAVFDTRRTALPLPTDAWAALQAHDRLYYRVATSIDPSLVVRNLQDSSTSSLTPEAAPWIDIVNTTRTARSEGGTGPTNVSDFDELHWRSARAVAGRQNGSHTATEVGHQN